MHAALAEEVTAGTPEAYIIQNLVLATLGKSDFELLRPHLTLVELKRNAILHDTNKPVEAVYFIETGVISRIARTLQDGSVEVAMVGRFGFIGVSIVLGATTALQRSVVQVPGQALRIDAKILPTRHARRTDDQRSSASVCPTADDAEGAGVALPRASRHRQARRALDAAGARAAAELISCP